VLHLLPASILKCRSLHAPLLTSRVEMQLS
jgi:hypothetical protein